MRKCVILFIGLIVAIGQLIIPAAARGQTRNPTAQRLNGIVKDALGRPLAEVDVNLETTDGHVIGTVRSDRQGAFSFPNVRPGTYATVAHKANFKPATAIVAVTKSAAKPVTLAMESEAALSLTVAAKRLDRSRNSLSPTTGGSSYTFTQRAISELPQGSNTPLNQVLLQAPGVVNDSFGQLHVRGDHADLQYRIDGVQLPEGIVGLTNSFSTRFANSISLLDGALPAEFGLRTAGIVDIHTKSGTIAPGGNIEFYGGQRETWQPSFEYGGTTGKFSYYMTGSYLHDTRGIEPPTSGPSPDHDKTEQGRFFGDFSYFITPTMRLTLLTGTAVTDIQIPGNVDQPTAFNLVGVPNDPRTGLPIYNSLNVREGQLEQNYYNVLALQGAFDKVDYQISAFSRYSTIHFRPDNIGDLVFNGASSDVFRSSFVNGLQGDASYHLGETHTLRSGFYFSGENAYIGNNELVFKTNPDGTQASNVPFKIVDNTQITDWLYGVYVQDEWRATERLTVNYGVRFDLSDAFVRADQFSPRFGVVYKLPTKTTLHAAYARHFTPPQTEVVHSSVFFNVAATTATPTTRCRANCSTRVSSDLRWFSRR
ncbi:MAG: TonB-dependent receptor [Deltaproteobacteria bacterium]|nr:TonB-dependent receptor [Deltaproteobacteria bacterium]